MSARQVLLQPKQRPRTRSSHTRGQLHFDSRVAINKLVRQMLQIDAQTRLVMLEVPAHTDDTNVS